MASETEDSNAPEKTTRFIEDDTNADIEAAKPLNDVVDSSDAAKKRRQSFAKRFQAVSMEKPPSKNPCGYIAAVFGLCMAGTAAGAGFCLCIGGLIILQFLPIISVVIGALYLDECSAEPIPLLILIGGCIHIVQGLLAMTIKSYRSRRTPAQLAAEEGKTDLEIAVENSGDENVPGALKIVNQLVSLISLGWFIGACVIVYRLYPNVSYDKLAPEDVYCHKLPFLFAFWYVTATFIILGLVGVGLICTCCCGIALAASG